MQYTTEVEVEVEVDLDEMPIEEVIEYLADKGYKVVPHSGVKSSLNDLVDAKIRNSPDFDKLFSEYVYDTLGRIVPW
jgi:hypothetical protein